MGDPRAVVAGCFPVAGERAGPGGALSALAWLRTAGGGFAPAATFPGVPALSDLKIAPGHAVLTFGPPAFGPPSTQPWSISTEPVS